MLTPQQIEQINTFGDFAKACGDLAQTLESSQDPQIIKIKDEIKTIQTHINSIDLAINGMVGDLASATADAAAAAVADAAAAVYNVVSNWFSPKTTSASSPSTEANELGFLDKFSKKFNEPINALDASLTKLTTLYSKLNITGSNVTTANELVGINKSIIAILDRIKNNPVLFFGSNLWLLMGQKSGAQESVQAEFGTRSKKVADANKSLVTKHAEVVRHENERQAAFDNFPQSPRLNFYKIISPVIIQKGMLFLANNLESKIDYAISVGNLVCRLKPMVDAIADVEIKAELMEKINEYIEEISQYKISFEQSANADTAGYSAFLAMVKKLEDELQISFKVRPEIDNSSAVAISTTESSPKGKPLSEPEDQIVESFFLEGLFQHSEQEEEFVVLHEDEKDDFVGAPEVAPDFPVLPKIPQAVVEIQPQAAPVPEQSNEGMSVVHNFAPLGNPMSSTASFQKMKREKAQAVQGLRDATDETHVLHHMHDILSMPYASLHVKIKLLTDSLEKPIKGQPINDQKQLALLCMAHICKNDHCKTADEIIEAMDRRQKRRAMLSSVNSPVCFSETFEQHLLEVYSFTGHLNNPVKMELLANTLNNTYDAVATLRDKMIREFDAIVSSAADLKLPASPIIKTYIPTFMMPNMPKGHYPLGEMAQARHTLMNNDTPTLQDCLDFTRVVQQETAKLQPSRGTSALMHWVTEAWNSLRAMFGFEVKRTHATATETLSVHALKYSTALQQELPLSTRTLPKLSPQG